MKLLNILSEIRKYGNTEIRKYGNTEIRKYGNTDTEQKRYYNIEKLFNLFEIVENFSSTIEEKVAKGIACVITNATVLGFDNLYDAVRMVVNNLKQNNK